MVSSNLRSRRATVKSSNVKYRYRMVQHIRVKQMYGMVSLGAGVVVSCQVMVLCRPVRFGDVVVS